MKRSEVRRVDGRGVGGGQRDTQTRSDLKETTDRWGKTRKSDEVREIN